VVHALQQAQVDVLIMNDAALSGDELFALDAEPWVAIDEGESLTATWLAGSRRRPPSSGQRH
jgi:hypothetical protein